MSATGAARLMILFDGDRTFQHRSIGEEIIARARRSRLAGASLFRGVEGFGSSQLVHTSRILDLSDRLPMMVLIVDSQQKIQDFLPQVEELNTGGVICVDDVTVIGPKSTPDQVC